MVGTTVSHYKIVDRLGAGGMGEVFLAFDTELERKVALKFLPPHVAPAPDALERFKREAKSTAALQHPNIVTIHEIGEHDGRHFIVMAYIEGDLLSDLIARNDLPVERTVDIALALCDALGEAHSVGIVHRDLKPNNIIVDGHGRAHVLDFGLAMVSGETKLTQEGTTVGTLHYMSPEQSRGDDVDARTDIFSLGAIIYEMVTGRHAFSGDHATAIYYKIANEDPQPLSRYNNQATPELERVVMTALAKDPDLRYQTMSGLGAALKTLRGGSQVTGAMSATHPAPSNGGWKYALVAVAVVAIAALGYWLFASRPVRDAKAPLSAIGEIRTIAVLPFKNSSGDSEQEYFSDGMTEALINELGKVSALNVISTYSAMQYKGKDEPLSAIAEELAADAVVQGSVQQAGDRVRVSVELTLARTGERLWGDSYDGEYGDALELQSDVALAITRQIKVNLAPFEDERLAQAHSVHPDALKAYMKGLYYRNLISREGLIKARESFERAAAIDPTFSLPYVALADVHLEIARDGVQPDANLSQTVSLAYKGLELDPLSEDAHTILAQVKLFFEWDWAGARGELDEARKLNPGAPSVRANYSTLLLLTGELDEGVSQHVMAIASNPLSHSLACSMPRKYYLGRQFGSAVEYGRDAAERFPFCPFERLAAGKALVKLSRYDEAIRELEASLSVQPTSGAVAWLACAHAYVGHTDDAKQALARLLEPDNYDPYLAAVVYTAMGEKERAFAALEEAYDNRSSDLLWLRTEPAFDTLRSHPHYADLVKRIGLPAS